VPKIADDDVEQFLGIYREIDSGAPEAACEVWYKLTPGQDPGVNRSDCSPSMEMAENL